MIYPSDNYLPPALGEKAAYPSEMAKVPSQM
jgi:hypothetical protein